ncbi:hypothetical protein G3I77_08510 [Streptomyces sp. D2-8]|uniref:hypothetical protein n=1 Tax=Streptomyces sp. D2-8 TaxID=2707767 RepID=UPI0020BDD11B|nr:hypothetical protein [Streptomyces sp. D2-8]MCK8433081.1 hypothetical protein [Streptomyces sp. D2-8]
MRSSSAVGRVASVGAVACRGHAHAGGHRNRRTAALLRRGRPADKELHAAGLLQPVGGLLWPGDPAGRADHAADAVRTLLGDRVSHLVRRCPWRDTPAGGRSAGFEAGALEDRRTVLELLAARSSRLGAAD